MRDPSGILFALFVLVAATVAFVAVVTHLRRKRAEARPAEERAAREEQARLRKLVDAGTHVLAADGLVAPKCFGCDAAATERPYEWARGEGVWDLIRRKFGAPRSVSVEQVAFGEPVSCRAHLALLHQLFKLDLGQQEIERAKLESEHETRRARFQREGVYERAREKIAEHNLEAGGRRRSRKSEAAPAKVLPFASSARTGTESK
jgi:hypothetical protein